MEDKLKVLFVIPQVGLNASSYENTDFITPLAPLRLEAYNRDIADFTLIDSSEEIPKETFNAVAITTTFFGTLSKGVTEMSLEFFYNILRRVKLLNIPILVGGNLPLFHPEIEKDVSWICLYEGEKPLREALLNIKNKKQLVSSRDHKPLSIEELENLPPLNVSSFKTGIMPIQLGIGCINNCIFCVSYRTLGRKLRHVSVEKMKSDINYYYANGIRNFLVVDDYIFSDKKYYMEIFTHIKNLGMKVEFPYLNMTLDEEEMELIASICQNWIFLNPDACNERIYKLVGKSGDWSNVTKIVNFFRKKGFYVGIQFVILYPFETENDRKEAIEFYSNLDVNQVCILPLTPIKGTPVYKYYENIKTDVLNLRNYAVAQQMAHAINSKLKNYIQMVK